MAETSPVARPAGSIKRQTLWSMMPLLVVSAVNIFSVPVFLQSLGDNRYALWTYVALLSGMFGFMDLGLGVVVGRYISVALGKGETKFVRGYWGTGNLIVLPMVTVMAVVFIALGVTLGPKWFQVTAGDAPLLRACFVVGGAALFCTYYSQYWLILAQAYLDFKFVGILRTGITLGQVIPQVILAYLTRNPFWIVLWGAGVSFVGLIIFVWHARRKYHIGFHFDEARWSYVSEMALYAGKSIAGLIAGSLFGSIDRVILGRLAAPSAFNPYAVSANLAGRLQGLSVAVMGPVFFNTSRVVSGDRSQAAKIYDETFAFVFEWYSFAAIWLGLWHPILFRIWLGEEMGIKTSPLVTPLIVACCLGALTNISAATLGSFNRLGTSVCCTVAAGLLAMGGVWIGWNVAGPVGAAYGFCASRVAFVVQDLFAIHLVKAGGWLSLGTWKQAALQCGVGLAFVPAYLLLPHGSFWLLVPATLHGGLMSAWLLRHNLRKFLAPLKTFQAL